LYGGWLGRKVILAEREMFGGQIINAEKIENYPGFHDAVLGADLVSRLRMQALKFGAQMQYLEITSNAATRVFACARRRRLTKPQGRPAVGVLR
jgi:thioredoxin reductase